MVGEDAIGLDRKDIDLRAVEALPTVLQALEPDAVINCAAYTKVDKAEEEEELATVVNGVAVGALAQWCADRGRPFLTFSTDYVFAGDATSPYVETSPTEPINAYGRSKLVGEELALERGALVVRTSWLVSGSHPSFVSRMIDLARAGGVSVVNDQRGRPTIAADLATASYRALRSGVTGVLHLANRGEATWFDLARAAVSVAGIDADLVSSCSSSEFPTQARRPAYSVLGTERGDEPGVEPLPHWRESLPDLVAEIVTWL